MNRDILKKILITGGAGFIGSHVVRQFIKSGSYEVFNLDKLTYAGNLENLTDVEADPNYHFIKGDICDYPFVKSLFQEHDFQGIIHLAAESHVDRSISNPMDFIQTNVVGTVTLLNVAKEFWNGRGGKRFYHISTDEVYGSLDNEGFFLESTPYDPKSPYSASKASSDHFVRAYGNTYSLPFIISNCSNNYGPNHFPEKLIPLMVNNIRNKKPLPVYGRGENIRDWLHVEDHARAIQLIFEKGRLGEKYNIGGGNEWKNIDLVHLLCDLIDQKLNNPPGTSRKLITFVKDRAGHDLRYAMDVTKLSKELGWKPLLQFEEGLQQTIKWYFENEEWLKAVTSGDYTKYYEQHYPSEVL
ncbi:MAG: dTDP-glucose 4,6-dehydratase [Ekhidna sp.]|nr:dTDP-glucose 4,6-dehydratase [Ekhidna sp.]